MKKSQMFRGVEDPISGTFSLAERISDRSERILFLSRFAMYFVWFSIVLYLLLMLTFLSQGNLFMTIVLLSLLITGVITAKLMSSLRRFLKESSFRYSAIKAMREGPPAHSVPEGKTATERFMNYLEKNNRALQRMLKYRPELLRKDSYAVGRSGKRYHFDAFIQKKPSLMHRLLKIGYPGYSLYVREYKRSPKMGDLKEIVKDLEDITSRGNAYPHRVCMLYRAKRSYSGLNDDVYDKLVSGQIWLKGNREKKMNIQVAVELPTGHYEFIPFIPELPRVLP